MSVHLRLVNGTDTAVGKTVATAALACAHHAAGRRVASVKPVQTGLLPGEPGDSAEVRRLAGVDTTELVRLPEPLAPESAAFRSGAELPAVAELARQVASWMDSATRPEIVLVEGAGGVAVRLDREGGTLLDLGIALESYGAVDVVLVVRAGLGTLSVTELSVEAIRRAGLEPAGIIVGSWPADPDLPARNNAEDLPRLTGVPLIGRIPAGAGALPPDRFRAESTSWLA